MAIPRIDRTQVRLKSLAERPSTTYLEKVLLKPDHPVQLSEEANELIGLLASRVQAARKNGRPVIAAFGAHTIRNGLTPVIEGMLKEGLITHLATNGAGFIHDWEFAYQGKTCEDVATGVQSGEFGNWQETGEFINIAINLGALHGVGYGKGIGQFILNDGANVPTTEELTKTLQTAPDSCASAAAMIEKTEQLNILPGRLDVPHPWKDNSLAAIASKLNVPFTAHPMFGQDIIYNHPMNSGALLGIAAEIDFEIYAAAVANLSGGVYLSVGSAIMSPMIFEKSISIARNIAHQNGEKIKDFTIVNVDLDATNWDWSQGEPPRDSAAYYRRNSKTFSRMGGDFFSLRLDNRDFFLGLSQALKKIF